MHGNYNLCITLLVLFIAQFDIRYSGLYNDEIRRRDKTRFTCTVTSEINFTTFNWQKKYFDIIHGRFHRQIINIITHINIEMLCPKTKSPTSLLHLADLSGDLEIMWRILFNNKSSSLSNCWEITYKVKEVGEFSIRNILFGKCNILR